MRADAPLNLTLVDLNDYYFPPEMMDEIHDAINNSASREDIDSHEAVLLAISAVKTRDTSTRH